MFFQGSVVSPGRHDFLHTLGVSRGGSWEEQTGSGDVYTRRGMSMENLRFMLAVVEVVVECSVGRQREAASGEVSACA